jgi:hypothetical protein
MEHRLRRDSPMTIDEEIEVMVRELIENHLTDDREAALKWLDDRVDAYQAMRDLGLIADEKTA